MASLSSYPCAISTCQEGHAKGDIFNLGPAGSIWADGLPGGLEFQSNAHASLGPLSGSRLTALMTLFGRLTANSQRSMRCSSSDHKRSIMQLREAE
jgi:hypothetical protein